MRAVIQRVSEASVSIENTMVSKINFGLLIFLGIEIEDTKEDSLWLGNVQKYDLGWLSPRLSKRNEIAKNMTTKKMRVYQKGICPQY